MAKHQRRSDAWPGPACEGGRQLKHKVLIVCRSPDPHVDAVARKLDHMGVRYCVLDVSAASHLGVQLRLGHASVEEFPYSAVWWRYKSSSAEYQGTPDTHTAFASREWLAYLRGVAAITDRQVRWINNPATAYLAGLKTYVLSTAQSLGLRIPKTCATNHPSEALDFVRSVKDCVYKTLTYYYEAPDVAIYTTRISEEHIRQHTSSIMRSPVLLQEYVPKAFEVRATVVGSEAVAVKIHSQEHTDTIVDWRRGQAVGSLYEPMSIPDNISEQMQSLMTALGLHYGAFDFVVTPSGEWVFLEVNPGGQFLWLEELAGIEITATVARYLSSCP